MKYDILKSGSSGNCTVIDGVIAIDIGVTYSKIKEYAKSIKVICLTHQHGDHINLTTLKKLKHEHPNIKYLCPKYLVAKIITGAHINPKNIYVIDIGKWYDLGLFKVKIEELYHDVPNVCYHIIYKDKKFFYATDTSYIDHIEAKNYDYYFIEGNYETDDELDQRIQEAKEKGEFTYLSRVKYTHLSQVQALNWLNNNMGDNSEYQFMHQHVDK